MMQEALDFLVKLFSNPSILGICLTVLFGAIWLACYRPPLITKPWLWAVLVAGIVMMGVAGLIDMGLEYFSGQILGHFLDEATIWRWLLIAAIFQTLLSGLVQEGAKLVPVVVYWWRKGRDIDPKLALVIGAVAGVGFGIIETQWILSGIFASGWSWSSVDSDGIVALSPLLVRFAILGFHAAACALASWGLAKGFGWQFYLLVSFLHALSYTGVFLFEEKVFSLNQALVFNITWALLIAGVALWLRWGRMKD